MEKENDIFELKKSIFIDGNECNEIPYNYRKITGEQIEEIFKESINDQYMVGASYELDPVIGARFFAKAADIDYTDVKRMGLVDSSKVASLSREFLITSLNKKKDKENVLILSEPIIIKGKEIKEIEYNFDGLTGEDTEFVFKEANRNQYIVSSSYELDPVIGARFFAKASKFEYSDMLKMNAEDYLTASAFARDFFIVSLSGDQEEDN